MVNVISVGFWEFGGSGRFFAWWAPLPPHFRTQKTPPPKLLRPRFSDIP